jgi:drug/metabolite transporter (DMT)-like permease
VIAILGGFGAAASWAVSTLCSSRSSRLIEPASVVAWVMLVGLLICAPAAALASAPARVAGGSWAWLALSGTGNVAGLMIAYAALRIGQVSLVAPLVSTEGAVAAIIALIAGESVRPAAGAALALVVLGVCLSGIPRRVPDAPGPLRYHAGSAAAGRRPHARAVGLAIAAAISFGVSLYATGRASSTLPAAWVVLSARAIGAAVLALPLACTGRLRITRAAVPLVIASGICEVAGFFSYTAGARHSIAVAAVLSSQFATLAAMVAFVLFKERLGRLQLAGVCTVILGVALLSGVSA